MSHRRPLPVALAVTALAAGLAAVPTALAPVASAAPGDGGDGPATTPGTVWRSPDSCAFSYTAAGEIGNGHAGNEALYKAGDTRTGAAAVQNFGLNDRSFGFRPWLKNYTVGRTDPQNTDVKVRYVVEHGPAGARYSIEPLAVGSRPLNPNVVHPGPMPAPVTADAQGRAEIGTLDFGAALLTDSKTRSWTGKLAGFGITGTTPEGTTWEGTGANVPYLTEYVTGNYVPLPGQNSSCRPLSVQAPTDAGVPFDGAAHRSGAIVTNADGKTEGYGGIVTTADGTAVEGAAVTVDPATGAVSVSVPAGTAGPVTVKVTHSGKDSWGDPATVDLDPTFTLADKPAPVLPDPTDPTTPGTGSIGGFGPGSLGALAAGSLGSLGSLGSPGTGPAAGSGSTPATGAPGTGSLGSLGSTEAPSGRPGQGSQAGSSAGSASTAGSSTR